MSGKFETIKPVEKPEWWKWEGTWVSKFGCHLDIVNAQIESKRKLYAEQGYEILDSYIEKGDMFARVKLLVRPIREGNEEEVKPVKGETRVSSKCKNGVKITAVFTLMSFKLILEFDNREYRLLNMKGFLKNEKGVLAEILDIDMFRTARVDRIAGTVVFENEVDFDPEILYKSSVNIDHITGNEGEMRHEGY
ncbi:DUF2442 domain-containing protein [Bacillus subtilis]|uniref:Uncharacterized protein n=1 Tax=Bacillus subtilis TaxID=1423 RepID=A0AAP1H660_BACIU|nr:DUF2442 domain-containing protein [Bacillus subtilis]KIN51157.1 hypothetical protein B4146_0617 [Bacillus subtilis]KZD87342.1 hypothetical protein B4122_4566 [Bacillus subtilis]